MSKETLVKKNVFLYVFLEAAVLWEEKNNLFCNVQTFYLFIVLYTHVLYSNQKIKWYK